MDLVGIAGGLDLLGSEEVSITVDSYSSHFVNLVCEFVESKQRMHITFINTTIMG